MDISNVENLHEESGQQIIIKRSNDRGICIHGKRKYNCINCGGKRVCEHGKWKYQCKICGGKGICEHGKRKYLCKICGGKGICEHGKRKYECKVCEGKGICEHKKVKYQCKVCGGKKICEHWKVRYQCKVCGGKGICKHGKSKSRCKSCNGSDLCKSDWCETHSNKKYKGYCLRCFIHLFPNEKNSRNYKTKEIEVVTKIREKYPNLDWISDKKIIDGCSKRRPDLLLDLGYHILVIEVDENKHSGYDCSCENKRLMEISQDLGHRNMVMIRFNPDRYIDEQGNKISSCWSVNRNTGIMFVSKKNEIKWQNRIDRLLEEIGYWMNHESDKMVEIVELFYDMNGRGPGKPNIENDDNNYTNHI